MDIVSILNSPAGVAVITALGVIIGARISAVLGIRTGAGGHVASFDNAHHNHVTQTTQHHVEHQRAEDRERGRRGVGPGGAAGVDEEARDGRAEGGAKALALQGVHQPILHAPGGQRAQAA